MATTTALIVIGFIVGLIVYTLVCEHEELMEKQARICEEISLLYYQH